MPREVKSQADKRRSFTPMDQFLRPWSVTIEIESGDWTGLVSSAGWEDPLRTPQNFIRPAKNEFGFVEFSRVEIDIPAWVRFQANSMNDWVRNFWKVGKELYKDRFDPNEMRDDAYLLEQAGPKPWPSVEAIEVLLQEGHQAHLALLGKVPVNDSAIKMLGRDPNEVAAIKEAAMTIQKKEYERGQRMKLTIIQFMALEPTPSFRELIVWGAENGFESKDGMKELAKRWSSFKDLREGTDDKPVVPIEDLAPEMETA